MLALILGVIGGGLLFFLLSRITKGIVSNNRIPLGALLLFLFTPLVVLLIVAFTKRENLLAAATAMVAVLLICSVIKILLANKNKRR